jgi:acyl-CoA reductase-like NAD-dependent aldehyde dehydrogenase
MNLVNKLLVASAKAQLRNAKKEKNLEKRDKILSKLRASLRKEKDRVEKISAKEISQVDAVLNATTAEIIKINSLSPAPQD